MRFATLIHEQDLRNRVSGALSSMGIEVLNFAAVDALIATLRTQAFAAILVEDDEDRIGLDLVDITRLDRAERGAEAAVVFRNYIVGRNRA